jgi:hypothetical protein
MIRVDCSCGKVLTIKNEMAGQSITCPKCQAMLTVPASTAISDRPFSSRRSRRADRDDNEEASGGSCLGKLLAGGFLLVVLLAAGGAAGWWFYLRDANPASNDVKIPATGPGSKQEPVAIKFSAPAKVGDVRDVKIVFEKSEQRVTTPPKSKAVTANFHDGPVHFAGRLKTLTIGRDGQALAYEITVVSFANQNKSDLLRPGTVLQKEDQAGKWVYRRTDGRPIVPTTYELLLALLGFSSKTSEGYDAAFGTTERKVVGDSWPINKQAVTTGFRDTGLEVAPEAVNGTSKFTGVVVEGGATLLEVEAKLTVDMTAVVTRQMAGAGDGTAETVITVTLRVPADGSTGPVKHTERGDSKRTLRYTGGPQAGATVEGTFTESRTVEVTYYPVNGTKKPEPLPSFDGDSATWVDIKDIKAVRSKTRDGIDVSLRYDFLKSNPLPDATYQVMVRVRAAKDKQETVQVGHTCKGTALQHQGTVEMFIDETQVRAGMVTFWITEAPPGGKERKVTGEVTPVVK